jgi:hypothetical protein
MWAKEDCAVSSLNTLFVGLLAASLAACSGDMTVTDTGGQTDAGTDVTVNDTGMTHPDVTTDTGTDVPSTSDAGAGTCGATTHTCLCGCGMDAACQQGCLTAPSCQTCVVNAQTACCPTEAATFATCATAAQMASDAGAACTTQACIQMRCATEVAAFQACITTASGSSTMCQGHFATCFGAYPLMCP